MEWGFRGSLSSASCVFDKANPGTFRAGKDQCSRAIAAPGAAELKPGSHTGLH